MLVRTTRNEAGMNSIACTLLNTSTQITSQNHHCFIWGGDHGIPPLKTAIYIVIITAIDSLIHKTLPIASYN